MSVRDKPLMLNLGCGDRTHEAWVNIDHSLKASLKSLWFVRPFLKTPSPAGYLHHNLRDGIPFPDGSADVVYSSHVLEHLERKDALPFLREIHRVLKPNGIVRLVVPDLERAVTAYLQALNALRGDGGNNIDAAERLEWATIHLLDQMVRRSPGGEMAPWLREHRNSSTVRAMRGVLKEIALSEDRFASKAGMASWVIRLLRLRDISDSGELHRWMYDDVSLARLLVESGYWDVRRFSHLESRIPSWASYALDCDPDSTPHQPDSIWMEGIKR